MSIGALNMPISDLTIPDRGDRPDPPRPMEDDADSVALRKEHVVGEAIVGAMARVNAITAGLLILIVGLDLGLLVLFEQENRPVLSVGSFLACRGDLEKTPFGVLPRNWPALATSNPDLGRLMVGVMIATLCGLAALLLALGFGLSRYQSWARWGQAATILLLCGSAALFGIGLGRRLDPDAYPALFHVSIAGRFLAGVAFGFVSGTLLALWCSAVRPVFRPDYRRAVSLSARLRPWRTGRRLGSTILVGLVAISLFVLLIFGPLGAVGDELVKRVRVMSYGD